MAQVSLAPRAVYLLAAASRSYSRPPGLTLAARLLSSRTPAHGPWCGLSISGQTQAMRAGRGREPVRQACGLRGQNTNGTLDLASCAPVASLTRAASGYTPKQLSPSALAGTRTTHGLAVCAARLRTVKGWILSVASTGAEVPIANSWSAVIEFNGLRAHAMLTDRPGTASALTLRSMPLIVIMWPGSAYLGLTEVTVKASGPLAGWAGPAESARARPASNASAEAATAVNITAAVVPARRHPRSPDGPPESPGIALVRMRRYLARWERAMALIVLRSANPRGRSRASTGGLDACAVASDTLSAYVLTNIRLSRETAVYEVLRSVKVKT
jgi:hypothetical protein